MAQTAETILLVGDSWAYYAYDTLAEECDSKESINKGISFMTAQKALDTDYVSTVAAEVYGMEVPVTITHIYLSIGGNDYMLPGDGNCEDEQLPIIQPKVQAVIQQLHDAFPGVSIIMSGYGTLAGLLPWCAQVSVTPLNTMLASAATQSAAGVSFLDVTWSFGQRRILGLKLSDYRYFRIGGVSREDDSDFSIDHILRLFDVIHLNGNGYLRMWNEPRFQQAFGCEMPSETSSDCAPRDDDECLSSSPGWSGWRCATSRWYCNSWAKDMHRCCPESCGTGALSQTDCDALSSKGECTYPNEAQPDCSRRKLNPIHEPFRADLQFVRKL